MYLCRSNTKIEEKSKIFSTFDTLTPNRTSDTHKPAQGTQERPASTQQAPSDHRSNRTLMPPTERTRTDAQLTNFRA